MRSGRGLWALGVSAAVLACAGQNDAATYRSIVQRAAQCKRTAPGLVAGTQPASDDASAAQALSDMRGCMALVFRAEAVEPLLRCMAEGPCDSACPAPGSVSMDPLPSHVAAGAACEQAMRRCGGHLTACKSVVAALLPLTDAVAADLQVCFQEPCEGVQDCIALLPGIVGGARVADCMMERAKQRAN